MKSKLVMDEIDRPLEEARTPKPQLVDGPLREELEREYQEQLASQTPPSTLGQAEDYDELFEQIKNTMPPRRENLLARYVMAANSEESPLREELLSRLSSPELDNVR